MNFKNIFVAGGQKNVAELVLKGEFLWTIKNCRT